MSIREVIVWHAVAERMPDSDCTVLIRALGENDVPVWLGWYDADDDRWLSVDAAEVKGVTHWADIPACREGAA